MSLEYANYILVVVTIATSSVLAWCTWTLVLATRKMAQSSEPHVVATLEPNKWMHHHFDLVVTNAGGGVAYEIELLFDPPIPNSEAREQRNKKPALQSISILRPGQKISSQVAEIPKIIDKQFGVIISWMPRPNSKREYLRYSLRLGTYKDMFIVGEPEPLIKISNQFEQLLKELGEIGKDAS